MINEYDEISRKSNQEYAVFLAKTEVLFPKTQLIKLLGCNDNYSKLLMWIETYNDKEVTTSVEAKDIVSAINLTSLNFSYCLDSKEMFWNFFKTCHSFKTAPWYHRDYVVQKVLGHKINIVDIL